MSDTALAARLIEALNAVAGGEAGASTALVSITMNVLSAEPAANVAAALTRKTRTLLFLSADAFDAKGERVAEASSVHKVLAAGV